MSGCGRSFPIATSRVFPVWQPISILAKAPSFYIYLDMSSCVTIGFPFATFMGLSSLLPVPRRHLVAWISRGDAYRFPRPVGSFELFAPFSPAAMLPPVSPRPPDLQPGSSCWRGFPPLFSIFTGAMSLTSPKAMYFPMGFPLGVSTLPSWPSPHTFGFVRLPGITGNLFPSGKNWFPVGYFS